MGGGMLDAVKIGDGEVIERRGSGVQLKALPVCARLVMDGGSGLQAWWWRWR
jgi:hypothetical protein